MKPHKWAKEIHAWADGADIEQRCHSPSIKEVIWSNWEQFDGEWTDEKHWEYRIKPQAKEPQYLYAYKQAPYPDGSRTTKVDISTIKLDIDAYIGKIKLEQDDE